MDPWTFDYRNPALIVHFEGDREVPVDSEVDHQSASLAFDTLDIDFDELRPLEHSKGSQEHPKVEFVSIDEIEGDRTPEGSCRVPSEVPK